MAHPLFWHRHACGNDIHIRAGVLTTGQVKGVETTIVVKPFGLIFHRSKKALI
jgi:hypothetical protein